MRSLRAELTGGGVESLPHFRMMIPPGWVAYDTTAETEQDLLRAASRRLMPAHRVDLQAALTGQLHSAMAKARSQGAIAMVLPGPDTSPALFAPASLIVMIREAPDGESITPFVVDVIRRRGGAALDDGQRIVRWTTQGSARIGDDELGSELVEYITPVPGSEQTRALHLAFSVAYPVDPSADVQVRVASWIELMDTHVATLRWDT